MAKTQREPAATRAAFLRFTPLTVRWKDLDSFGHVNNAEIYSYFDTAIVSFLLEIGAFAVKEGPFVAMVVESGARFHREVKFGTEISVGLAITEIGTSSVRYRIGVFQGADAAASADGFFVHVFVDRQSRRPTPILPEIRARFEALKVAGPEGVDG